MNVRTSSRCFRQVRQLSRPVAAALLLSGCFYYVPAAYPPPPAPQSEVRINLAQPRDVPMGEFTLNEVTRIEGVVAEASEDTVGIWAQWLSPRIGRKYRAAGATFYVPRSDIASVDGWRFSAKRTLLLGGVTAVAVALLGAAVKSSLFGGLDAGVDPIQNSITAPR